MNTLSETHWNVPGIEAYFAACIVGDKINQALRALSIYKSQLLMRSRSLESSKALAKFRGT